MIAIAEFVLEGVIGAVVAVEGMLHSRFGQGGIVDVAIFGRRAFVEVPEEADYRTLDVAGKIYRRRIACAHGLSHTPAIENRARRELGIGHRAHPGHAPAPAMADDADAIGAHVLHA